MGYTPRLTFNTGGDLNPRRTVSSSTPVIALSALKGTPCAVGAPIAPDDPHPADSFPGWEVTRRSEMSFDDPGEVVTFAGAEVLRDSRATTSDTHNERSPTFPLVRLTGSQYQIPSMIATPRMTILSKREYLYVHRMFRYLSFIVGDLMVPPVQLIIDLPEMRRRRNSISDSVVHLSSWYGHAMLVGHLVLHRD